MTRRKLNVLHLVPATVSDFVRKDMVYLEKYAPVKTSVMNVGWSGRRHLILSLVSLIRMTLRSLIIRSKRPDLIHAHFLRSAFTAAMSGIPAVLTMHDSHVEMPLFWRTILKLAARRCSIIYVSNYNRECWAPILGKQGTVVYHAIDTADYSPDGNTPTIRKSYLDGLGTSSFVVSMGAMTPVRGLHLVVQAVAEVRKKGIDAGVVLKGYGGDPEYTARVERLAARLNVPLMVITSFISDQEMASMIASVESFGIAVLEAQACGTPVIITDCCSLKEVFSDSSLRFEPRDYKNLAEKIVEVLSDERLKSQLIASGLKNASNLNWKRKINSYIEVYKGAISGIRP